jgi:flagellar FliL protein
MPTPEEQIDKINEDALTPNPKKSGINLKIFIFGLPIFIVQLVAVYFITANILLHKIESRSIKGDGAAAGTQVSDSTDKVKVLDLGKFIYTIEDIIVNPADTDGKRLLLTSVGLDVPQQKMEEELKTREAMVKDVIISTLSSKTIPELNNTAYRDTLKTTISKKLMTIVPAVKINNVYFSKYIIQ